MHWETNIQLNVQTEFEPDRLSQQALIDAVSEAAIATSLEHGQVTVLTSVTDMPDTDQERTMRAIIEAMAVNEPYFPHEGQTVCSLCDMAVTEAQPDECAQHMPDCPYRMAAEFVR